MLFRIPVFIAAAAASILGVLQKDQHLYSPDSDGMWHCLLDPSIVLRPEQINDGFCDCPDGSDEPATHACPYPANEPLFFYCENKGFFPRLLERHKLNDGVCDYDVCCDGSDEWKSGLCPDKCEQVKQQYNSYIQEAQAKVSSALDTRKQYAEKAQNAKQTLEEKLAKARQDASTATALATKLQQELKQAEKDAENAPQDNAGPGLQEFGQKIQETLDAYKQQAEQHKNELRQLQNMVADLFANYNPNFNDAAVKRCVKLYGEYVSNKADEKSVPELAVDNLISEISLVIGNRPASAISAVPTFSNMWHHYYSQIIGLFAPQPESTQSQPDDAPRSAGNSKKVAQISLELKRAENAVQAAKTEVSLLEDRLSRNYGDDDILRGVEGEWTVQKWSEYTYKIGLLDAIYQDTTLVGRFSGVDGNVVQFSGGNKCWNGPQRSARVELVCGAEQKIVSVSEPEKCQYEILFETPLVCKSMSEEEMGKHFVVDLDRL